MEVIKAADVSRYDNWTCLIYSEPGVGKTTMVKALQGNTILWSVDGMYHVLQGVPHVSIVKMDTTDPINELEQFYKYVVKYQKSIDNIVIDNLSTFQKLWLNKVAKETRSGMPEIKDYGIIDRVLMDMVADFKLLNKNLLLFAHEKKVEITRLSGGVYTQFQPDIRNLDAIMGIVPLVGRLVRIKNKETQEAERLIILTPTQSTRAKDQLIGDIETINQMELIPTLQTKGE